MGFDPKIYDLTKYLLMKLASTFKNMSVSNYKPLVSKFGASSSH